MWILFVSNKRCCGTDRLSSYAMANLLDPRFHGAQVDHFGKMEELRGRLAEQMESMMAAKASPVSAVKEEEGDEEEEEEADDDEAGRADGAGGGGGGAITRVGRDQPSSPQNFRENNLHLPVTVMGLPGLVLIY